MSPLAWETSDVPEPRCATEWKAGLFVSADKRQVAAARKAGLQARLV